VILLSQSSSGHSERSSFASPSEHRSESEYLSEHQSESLSEHLSETDWAILGQTVGVRSSPADWLMLGELEGVRSYSQQQWPQPQTLCNPPQGTG
jgi:hypothetical protein